MHMIRKIGARKWSRFMVPVSGASAMGKLLRCKLLTVTATRDVRMTYCHDYKIIKCLYH